MERDRRLRKRERLTRREDYARVFRRRCSAADDILIVYVAENGLTWSRIGLRVNKRTGNAVRRNYIRRRIREAFRLHKADLPASFDVIAVARAKAGERDYDVARSLQSLIIKATQQCREPPGRARRPRPDPDTARK